MTLTVVALAAVKPKMACVCHQFSESDGEYVLSSECGFTCKDVSAAADCAIGSAGQIWAGSRPQVKLTQNSTCADFKGKKPASSAIPKNEYLWPTDKTENLKAVKAVHDAAPDVLQSVKPVAGTFIIMLTQISIACDPNMPGCTHESVVNGDRMKRIKDKLTQIQQDGGNFCGEVTGELRFLNMMICNLSPHCTKWIAQQPEIDSIEPDGVVELTDPVPEEDNIVGTTGAAVVVASSISTPKSMPVAAAVEDTPLPFTLPEKYAAAKPSLRGTAFTQSTSDPRR